MHHPIYHFIKAKYQQTGQYWLAICAGARKILTVLWYLLQKNDSWKLIQTPQTKIQRKIHTHIRQIERCEKLQQRLTARLGQQLAPVLMPIQDPNHLLRELLKAS
ncbi:MAG: hypothetical protein ACFFDI_23285 [Promethearchaeota archaeon]